MSNPNIVVVLGPTASGKTRLAAALASRMHSAVISADSRQVYRDMNIGTGKDLQEYVVDGNPVPHYLIDITDAGSHYDLHEYMKDFASAWHEVTQKKQIPVLCGGTGLYIEAVLKGFEYSSVPVNDGLREKLRNQTHEELKEIFYSMPATAYTAKADVSTHKRTIRAIEICNYLQTHQHNAPQMPALHPLVLGLHSDTGTRRTRITQRLQHRLQNGLIEEIEQLQQKGVSSEKLVFYGLEYKFITRYLQQQLSRSDMELMLTTAIQQYARRQMTYFRKLERQGLTIHWIDATLPFEKQFELAWSLVSSLPVSNSMP